MEPAYKLSYPVRLELPSDNADQKTRKRKKVPAGAVICIAAIFCVTCALFYLNQQVMSMQMNVKIRNSQATLNQLKQERDYLIIQLEQISRLEYIETRARADLGMIDPGAAEMLVMNINEVSGGEGEGWVSGEETSNDNLFMVVANWLNKWLPVGGVEAGRIGQ